MMDILAYLNCSDNKEQTHVKLQVQIDGALGVIRHCIWSGELSYCAILPLSVLSSYLYLFIIRISSCFDVIKS